MKEMSSRSAAVSGSNPGDMSSLSLLVFLIFLLVFPTGVMAESRIGSLVVLGLENDVKDEAWQDLRIGFGLTSLVSQKFFDLGLFQFIEEDPRQRSHLEDRRRSLWQGTHMCRESCFRDEATFFGVIFVAVGRVVDFSVSKSKAFIGPISTASRKSTVSIVIDLYRADRNEVLTCRGEGSAATRAGALLFEFREDAIAFDRSSIGPATEKAIDKAVTCLSKKMEKKGWLPTRIK